jgi:hypothetical protein
MKRLAIICLFFTSLHTSAQDSLGYQELLNTTHEMDVTDSLLIDGVTSQMPALDSHAVKTWFSRLLPNTANNRLKNRIYYLAGKITTHNNFNLLLLMEEKRRADSSIAQVVYFVTTKKDGSFISSLEAVVSGNRKKSSYNTSCWIFKDYKIVKDSKIVVNQRIYDDIASYKISGSGRFILYSN